MENNILVREAAKKKEKSPKINKEIENENEK